ncbi:MAG: hypothetical protein HYX72_01860 [Acidobacteria bacterium]|nr:hypothetical protein [Acidobacteriota bacterium]
MQNGSNKSGASSRWGDGRWRTPLPTLGCEISDEGISIARWSRSSSSLETAAWRPLAAGAIEASPLHDNIQQPEAVQRAFAEALSSLGVTASSAVRKPTDAVLVIPDQAARLFVLSFDTFPDNISQGLPLVKWRLKKSLPFDVESAAISYFVQGSGSELQVVAVAAPQRIIWQYESVAEQFGFRPKWVTLSTLAALGLAPGEDERAPAVVGDAGRLIAGVLIAKYNPPWFTTAILQGATLRLFRTVALPAGEDGLLSPADVLGSVYPSIAYFQDNFQGTVTHGFLCGLGENSGNVASSLRDELQLNTSPLVEDFDGVVSGMDPYRAERHFAALLGIVRERQIA